MKKKLISSIIVLLLIAGCQFDFNSRTEGSAKIFRSDENQGDIYKSRQVHSDFDNGSGSVHSWGNNK